MRRLRQLRPKRLRKVTRKKLQHFPHATFYTQLTVTHSPLSFLFSAKLKSNPKCASVIVDVGFIIDSSGSLRNSYKDEMKFVKLLAKQFKISKDGSHVSILSFSDKATLRMKFGEVNELEAFKTAVDGIAHEGGRTRIDLALGLARDEMFLVKNGARSNIPKLLILMTDGSQSADRDAQDPAAIAKEIRDMGINVIVIGIGNGVDTTELEALSGQDNWYKAKSFSELISDGFVRKMTRATCDIGKSVSFDQSNVFLS